jgi:hypothetical protein
MIILINCSEGITSAFRGPEDKNELWCKEAEKSRAKLSRQD